MMPSVDAYHAVLFRPFPEIGTNNYHYLSTLVLYRLDAYYSLIRPPDIHVDIHTMISGLDHTIFPFPAPVSYTHLTLPTKRIV